MFPDRMVSIMRQKKISRKNISHDLNFGINQIKYWENNRNIPNAILLSDIANYLGTNVPYLLETIDDPSPVPLTASYKQSSAEESPPSTLPSTLSQLLEVMDTMSKEELTVLNAYLSHLLKQKDPRP